MLSRWATLTTVCWTPLLWGFYVGRCINHTDACSLRLLNCSRDTSKDFQVGPGHQVTTVLQACQHHKHLQQAGPGACSPHTSQTNTHAAAPAGGAPTSCMNSSGSSSSSLAIWARFGNQALTLAILLTFSSWSTGRYTAAVQHVHINRQTGWVVQQRTAGVLGGRARVLARLHDNLDSLAVMQCKVNKVRPETWQLLKGRRGRSSKSLRRLLHSHCAHAQPAIQRSQHCS